MTTAAEILEAPLRKEQSRDADGKFGSGGGASAKPKTVARAERNIQSALTAVQYHTRDCKTCTRATSKAEMCNEGQARKTKLSQAVAAHPKVEKSAMPMTAAELFEKRRGLTAADVLRKAESATAEAPRAERIGGSFEHFVDRISPAVIGATPCPKKNGADGEHQPTVKATFADNALVGCDACGKTWQVPFGIGEGDEIVPGEPAERVQTYVDPNPQPAAAGGAAAGQASTQPNTS